MWLSIDSEGINYGKGHEITDNSHKYALGQEVNRNEENKWVRSSKPEQTCPVWRVQLPSYSAQAESCHSEWHPSLARSSGLFSRSQESGFLCEIRLLFFFEHSTNSREGREEQEGKRQWGRGGGRCNTMWKPVQRPDVTTVEWAAHVERVPGHREWKLTAVILPYLEKAHLGSLEPL